MCSSFILASVFLLFAAMQDCTMALGVPFHGYIPLSNVKAPPPEGDQGPNDIYSHIPIRRRQLSQDELVIYPIFSGFEQGKDSERKVYEVLTVKELIRNRLRKEGPKGASLPQSS